MALNKFVERKRKCLTKLYPNDVPNARVLNPFLSFINILLAKMAVNIGVKNAKRCNKKSISELRRANKYKKKAVKDIVKAKKVNRLWVDIIKVEKVNRFIENIGRAANTSRLIKDISKAKKVKLLTKKVREDI